MSKVTLATDVVPSTKTTCHHCSYVGRVYYQDGENTKWADAYLHTTDGVQRVIFRNSDGEIGNIEINSVSKEPWDWVANPREDDIFRLAAEKVADHIGGVKTVTHRPRIVPGDQLMYKSKSNGMWTCVAYTVESTDVEGITVSENGRYANAIFSWDRVQERLDNGEFTMLEEV